ncbi:MAG: hypothetical protein WCD70_12600 [Alphaproteobacteria bacterium]
METTGKARIKAAKTLAKTHGVEVLGWKDKPGEETISLRGDGSKLQSLRKEMEQDGWHIWPVEEAAEGFLMDFGMQPPPPNLMQANGLSTEANESYIPYAGKEYRYRGLTEAFIPYTIVIWCIAAFVGLYSLKYSLISLPKQMFNKENLILWAILLMIISGSIVAIFDWTNIYADKSKLIIRNKFRNLFLKQPQEIPLANIRKIKIYTTELGRSKSDSLVISLESGRGIELFLPKRVRGELASFIKGNISI